MFLGKSVGQQFLLSIGVEAPDLAYWGGLWVSKHHWKFKTLSIITYYCLSASPKKAAEHDKLIDWLIDWLCFLLLYLWKDIHASKSGIQYFKGSRGKLMSFDSHLCSLPQLQAYNKDAIGGGNLENIESSVARTLCCK